MANDPHELTIRVQSLNGVWETLGSDRYSNAVPENVTYSFNTWGPDTCSFTLKRSPTGNYPDLTTWTPIEVEVAGVLVWDGRLKETPTAEGTAPVISVQAEGWQYHLDDDVYAYSYVHTRLNFVDSRSLPTADLTTNPQVFNVSAGEGQLLIGLANATTVAISTGGSAMIDLGPGCSAMSLSIDVSSSFNTPSFTLYVMGTNEPWWNHSSRLDFVSGLAMNDAGFVAANTTRTINADISEPRRFITVLFYSSVAGALGQDHWFKVTGFRLFGVAAYRSGAASILKADTVIKHVLPRAAPLMSTDVSRIAAGTFAIPEFALEGLHTPREIISAVNSYENYELKVLVGRRLSFQPRASTPIYEIGQWSGADFTDASANSGDELYNRVLVQGTGPDGSSMEIERMTIGPPWQASSGVTVPNPEFEVDVSSWFSVPTIIRDTGQFNRGVASARFTSSGTSSPPFGAVFSASTTITGLTLGNQYVFSFYWRRAATTVYALEVGIDDGFGSFSSGLTSGRWRQYPDAVLPLNTWTQCLFPFSAVATSHTFQIAGGLTPINTIAGYLDSVEILRSATTLVDRRGFRRTKILPVSTSLTLTMGQRLGDLYLAAHKTTPFRGSFKAEPMGVRRVIGGSPVHPASIQPGALVRCTHLIDPDTGAVGRDGRIATTQYDHNSLTTQISLDENREGFEALLSRLAVVVGQRQV